MTTEKQTSSPYSSRSCEPVVMINGHRLTEGQATTLRVAIQSFDAFSGDNAFGKELSAAYEARTREIISLIFASPASPENHVEDDNPSDTAYRDWLNRNGHKHNHMRAMAFEQGYRAGKKAALTAPPQTNLVGLTRHEIDFCLLVYRAPGVKLNGPDEANHWEDDGSEYGTFHAHWTKPEALDLIRCVGSYKWEPTELLENLIRTALSPSPSTKQTREAQ